MSTQEQMFIDHVADLEAGHPDLSWLYHVRRQHRAGTLPPHREAMIVAAVPGFDWSIAPRGGPPKNRPRDPRLDGMLDRYDKGEPLASIGAHYGVTRERVRQIVMSERLPRVHIHAKPLTASDRLTALEMALDGVTRKAVMAKVGRRSMEWVDALSPSPFLMARRNAAVAVGTRDNPDPLARWLDRLRAAHGDLNEPSGLTRVGYRRWAEEHREPGPQTLYQFFESWGEACEAAGIPSGTKRAGPHRFVDDDYFEKVIIEFVSDEVSADRPPTLEAYRSWCAAKNSHAPGTVPSAATIRKVSGWQRIIDETAARLLREAHADLVAALTRDVAADGPE